MSWAARAACGGGGGGRWDAVETGYVVGGLELCRGGRISKRLKPAARTVVTSFMVECSKFSSSRRVAREGADVWGLAER